jgi:hypothetical protein
LDLDPDPYPDPYWSPASASGSGSGSGSGKNEYGSETLVDSSSGKVTLSVGSVLVRKQVAGIQTILMRMRILVWILLDNDIL